MTETTLLSQIDKVNSLKVPDWKKNEYRGLIFRKFEKRSALVRGAIQGQTTFEDYVNKFSQKLVNLQSLVPIRPNPNLDRELEEGGLQSVFGESSMRVLKTADGGISRFIKNTFYNPLGFSLLCGLIGTMAVTTEHFREMTPAHYAALFLREFNNGLLLSFPIVLIKRATYTILRNQSRFLDENLREWKEYSQYMEIK